MKANHKEQYITIVKEIAKCSKYNGLKVGAMIIKNGRIISTGYNGNPTNKSEKKIYLNGNSVGVIHAEMNALCFAAKNGIKIDGCEMVITHHPCINCMKLMYQAGIKMIYYLEDYENHRNEYSKLIKMKKLTTRNDTTKQPKSGQ